MLRQYIRTCFTLLFFTSLSTLSFSQDLKTDIKGAVVDSSDIALISATVVLLQAHDSIMKDFAITDDAGRFIFRKVPVGDYILQASYLGFETINQTVSPKGDQKEIDLGLVKMSKASAVLDVVEVTADHVPITIRKDTFEYNAGAFKVEPNADVEALLKKLPGVEVDQDGIIKAHGKEVERLLVDGEEFFGTDPKIATKNLPADAVDKVQVFDKKSELAEFTGVDDGEEQKTINLKLKEDSKKGYFGTVAAGYGSEDRYQGRFNLNRFNKGTQFSAIGTFNNINQQGFSPGEYIDFMGGISSFMQGGGRIEINGADFPISNGNNDGFTRTSAGGLNFNHKFSKKTKWKSSYFLNGRKTEMDRESDQQNFLTENPFTEREQNSQISDQLNHRFRGSLEHEIDSFSTVRLRGDLTINDGSSIQNSFSQISSGESELKNESSTNYFSDGNQNSWNADLMYRRKFRRVGRSFSANMRYGKQDNEGFADLFNNNSFYFYDPFDIVRDSLMQYQTSLDDQRSLNIRTTFTEPIGKSQYLIGEYTHNETRNDQVQEVFDYIDPEEGLLGDLNDDLSNDYDRKYSYDRGTLTYRMNRDKASYNIGLSLQESNLEGLVSSDQSKISKSFTNLLPRVRIQWDLRSSENLRLNYDTNVREPSLRQLQPFPDNDDPLNIYIGNPDLRPAYNHTVRFNYFSYRLYSQTSIFGSLTGTLTENPIINSTFVDDLFRQITRPINVDQQISLNVFGSYGMPLRFIKARLSLDANVRWSDSPVLVNMLEDTRRNTQRGIGVRLNNKNTDVVDYTFGFKLNQTRTNYETNESSSTTYGDQRYFGDVAFKFAKTWTIRTEMNYSIYAADAFEDRQVLPIWNASISKYIWEGKRGEIRLSITDILDKNRGINRTSNLNYIQEERVTSLGRYAMLSFIYSLKAFGGKEGGTVIKIDH